MTNRIEMRICSLIIVCVSEISRRFVRFCFSLRPLPIPRLARARNCCRLLYTAFIKDYISALQTSLESFCIHTSRAVPFERTALPTELAPTDMTKKTRHTEYALLYILYNRERTMFKITRFRCEDIQIIKKNTISIPAKLNHSCIA